MLAAVQKQVVEIRNLFKVVSPRTSETTFRGDGGLRAEVAELWDGGKLSNTANAIVAI